MSGASSVDPLLPLATAVDALIEIAKASVNLLFLVGNGIFKMYLKKIERETTQKIFFVG